MRCTRSIIYHLHGLYEGHTVDLVLAHANHVGWRLGCRLEESVDGFHTLECGLQQNDALKRVYADVNSNDAP